MFSLHVYVHVCVPGVLTGPRRASDPPRTEITNVNHHVGAEMRTWILWEEETVRLTIEPLIYPLRTEM